jgi:hypothetical protein
MPAHGGSRWTVAVKTQRRLPAILTIPGVLRPWVPPLRLKYALTGI